MNDNEQGLLMHEQVQLGVIRVVQPGPEPRMKSPESQSGSLKSAANYLEILNQTLLPHPDSQSLQITGQNLDSLT